MASGKLLREINEAAKEGFRFIPRAILVVFRMACEWWGLIALGGFIFGLLLYLVTK